jgi:hypothetical protein
LARLAASDCRSSTRIRKIVQWTRLYSHRCVQRTPVYYSPVQSSCSSSPIPAPFDHGSPCTRLNSQANLATTDDASIDRRTQYSYRWMAAPSYGTLLRDFHCRIHEEPSKIEALLYIHRGWCLCPQRCPNVFRVVCLFTEQAEWCGENSGTCGALVEAMDWWWRPRFFAGRDMQRTFPAEIKSVAWGERSLPPSGFRHKITFWYIISKNAS